MTTLANIFPARVRDTKLVARASRPLWRERPAPAIRDMANLPRFVGVLAMTAHGRDARATAGILPALPHRPCALCERTRL